MPRLYLWLSAILTLAGGNLVIAADPPKPALEIRAKSIQDLVGPFAHFMQMAGQKDTATQMVAVVKVFVDNEKGFEGVELKKPIGGYVAISENVADSPVVLMLPIANEEAFTEMIKDKGKLKPKKLEDGVSTVELPNFPFPVFYRFSNDYLYVTIRSEKAIDKKLLLAPADFFAKKLTTAFAATLNLDLVPADLKKVAYGQIEMQLAEAAKEAGGNELEKQARKFLVDTVSEMAKVLLTDAKELSIAIDIVPKSDEFIFDLVLTPNTGTTLSKTLLSWGDRSSKAASIAEVKNPIVGVGINFPLPKGTTEKLTKLYETAVEASLENAAGEELEIKKDVLQSILPTVKAGDLQFGGIFTKGKENYSILSGTGLKELKQFMKVLKNVAEKIPGEIVGFEFDKENAHGFDWHRLELPDQFETDSHELIGKMAWIGNSDDLYLLSFGKTAEAAKAIAAAKTVPASRMLTMELSAARLALANSIGSGQKDLQKQIESKITELFGKEGPAGQDTLRLTASGGKDFKLHFEMKGKAFLFFEPSKMK